MRVEAIRRVAERFGGGNDGMNDEYARMVEDARKADEAERAKMSALIAKRERNDIALRFAVSAYGGYWSNVDITSEPETIVDASFRMADAFIAARDGAS